MSFRLTVVLVMLCALTACDRVDQFSSRAQSYNDQAEQIKEQQFLTNILRAAYREPLQFSDFSQVTGQAAISGTAAFTLPVSTFPSSLSRTYTAAPGATISGNQSFTVVNLNTQDFYEGILSPIPMSTIDYYMQAEYPKALVLTLFLQRIELKPPYGAGAPVVFDNAYQDGRYQRFEAVLQAAIDLGLTTETVDSTEPVGPPMTAAQLADLRDLAAIAPTGAVLKTYKLNAPAGAPADPNLSPALAKAFRAQGVDQYYQLITAAKKTHFCFESDQQGGNFSSQALAAANTILTQAGVLHSGLSLAAIKIPPPDICGTMNQAAGDTDAGSAAGRVVEFEVSGGLHPVQKYQIIITTRSVESIMYYLGEWSRAELAIDPGTTPVAAPLVATGSGQDRLFVVAQDCPDGFPKVEAAYNGATYCMGIDPTGADRSGQVMEIISQLFALNNSAKDLPSSGLISVLSP